MPFLEEIRFLTQGLMIKLKKEKYISILVPMSSTRVRNQIIWFLTQGFITGVYGIMQLSQNVSIRWEINFYDKNTCKGKGISEHN